MKHFVMMFIGFVLIAIISINGCRKKEKEHHAEAEFFIGYEQWQVLDYNIFQNPLLSDIHAEQGREYARRVYMKPGGKLVRGKYPNGTYFVIETFTWENDEKIFQKTYGRLAMVKKGGDYNPKANGWEWFFLESDVVMGGITRGGEFIAEGTCNSCHSLAKDTEGNDLVFSHPIEYAADDAIFADYKDWPLIGETAEPHPKLMEAHKGGLRRVFKKQLMANPDTDWGYPTGTIIVKDVKKDSEITSITAMVKRGGEFNKEHGGWEWFVINPKDYTVKDRGADLMDGMCSMCHEAANEPEFGIDYVFKHPNDPFNK